MKFLVLLLLIGCGKKVVFDGFDNSSNDARLSELEEKVFELEYKAELDIATMQAVNDSLNFIKDEITSNNIANVNQNAAISNLTNVLNLLQNKVNNAVSNIAQLQLNENIVAHLDPCGDGEGYDEILLKTSSGKVVAYFENGDKRHLTLLQAFTPYQTTDIQGCLFQVDNDGNLI